MNKREFLRRSAAVVCTALCGGCLDKRRTVDAERGDAESSWTLIVLPDTQYYSQKHPEVFEAQTRWIAANKEALNIKYIVHLGDVTEHNNPEQWQAARRAMAILDGTVPYAIALGNHDYSRNGQAADRTTLFNEWFKYADCAAWPTFGGAMAEGELENTFHCFHAGGKKWLILALEWGPRNSVLAWADSVLTQHPDHNVILVTHAYLYHDSTRFDWAAKEKTQNWSPYIYGTARHPDGTNDGQDIWNKLLKHHPSAVMTLNGHIVETGVGYLKSSGIGGNTVHQIVVNFQEGVKNLPRDGSAPPDQTISDDGSLRILEFQADRMTVKISDYSPYRRYYAKGPLHRFRITL